MNSFGEVIGKGRFVGRVWPPFVLLSLVFSQSGYAAGLATISESKEVKLGRRAISDGSDSAFCSRPPTQTITPNGAGGMVTEGLCFKSMIAKYDKEFPDKAHSSQ
jgi:hypothetical protein